jgi:hypothetical protein
LGNEGEHLLGGRDTARGSSAQSALGDAEHDVMNGVLSLSFSIRRRPIEVAYAFGPRTAGVGLRRQITSPRACQLSPAPDDLPRDLQPLECRRPHARKGRAGSRSAATTPSTRYERSHHSATARDGASSTGAVSAPSRYSRSLLQTRYPTPTARTHRHPEERGVSNRASVPHSLTFRLGPRRMSDSPALVAPTISRTTRSSHLRFETLGAAGPKVRW